MAVSFISSSWQAFLKVKSYWSSYEQMLMITGLYFFLFFLFAIYTSASLNLCSFCWERGISEHQPCLGHPHVTGLWEDLEWPILYRQMDCWASSAGSFTGVPFDALVSAKTAGYLSSFSLHYACSCVNTSNMTHFEKSTKDVIFHINYVWPLFAYIQWFCNELLTSHNKITVYKCKFLGPEREAIGASFSKCLISLRE